MVTCTDDICFWAAGTLEDTTVISAAEEQSDVQKKSPSGTLRCWWDLVKSEHPASCRWVIDPALHLREFCTFNNLRASVGGALMFLLEKKPEGNPSISYCM